MHNRLPVADLNPGSFFSFPSCHNREPKENYENYSYSDPVRSVRNRDFTPAQ
jgi:hypothetical protein